MRKKKLQRNQGNNKSNYNYDCLKIKLINFQALKCV